LTESSEASRYCSLNVRPHHYRSESMKMPRLLTDVTGKTWTPSIDNTVFGSWCYAVDLLYTRGPRLVWIYKLSVDPSCSFVCARLIIHHIPLLDDERYESSSFIYWDGVQSCLVFACIHFDNSFLSFHGTQWQRTLGPSQSQFEVQLIRK